MDALCALLLLLGLGARIAALPFQSRDMHYFFIPWYQHIVPSFPASIVHYAGNYNFPYVYLLWLSHLLFGPSRPLLAVKAISVAADLALSAAVALAVKGAGAQVSTSRAFALTWCIPTVILNSSVWGQCDAIYTTFIVASVAAAIRGRGFTAAVLMGVAFSFKLQTVFIGPFLVLLIWQKRISAAAVPVGFAAAALMSLPAAVAGRPLADLLMVYVAQTQAYHELALLAPNPWSVLEHVGWIARSFAASLAAGIALAAAGSIAYLLRGRIPGFSPGKYLIEAAFVSVFMCPFLLPEMHERYFFPADVLAATMAMADKRWTLTAVLVQIASLSAYCEYLSGVHGLVAIGVACDSLVFCCILARWSREVIRPPRWVAQFCGAVLPLEG